MRIAKPQFTAVQGRFPSNADEVAIDEATAKRHNLKVGQVMIVAGSAPAKRYTIVGITRFGGGESFGGAGAAILTPVEAQRVVGLPGHFDQIDVAAQPGVTANDLRNRIRAGLPAAVDVRTGAQQAAKDTSDLEHNLGFIRTFLLVFAYVSLVVGAFIIFNTFSITVAQRTREFGLLRTLGSSRRQIMQSVVYEGLLLGVAGAVLGLLGGLVLAPALNELFKAFGAELPHSGTVVQTRTVVVSLAVGIIVTLLAGLPPALRATRVPPLAAILQLYQMRSGADMKVNVEIDCTPLEARQFFGLPDVQPMQTAVMEKLQHQMMANIAKVSPEALMQSWFTFDPKIAERFQDMFATMAGLGGSRASDKK